MVTPPKPYDLPSSDDIDLQRLLAESRMEGGENREVIARDLSVKLACAQGEAAKALENARAEAAAAQAQAQAAVTAAQEQAAASSAMAAMDEAATAATQAQDLLDRANALLMLCDSGSTSAAMAAAREAAESAVASAQAMLDEAQALVDLLARLGIAPPPSTGPTTTALVVLPEDEEDPVTRFEANTRDQPGRYEDELLTLLDGVEIPEELQTRVANVLQAMASIDRLVEQGMNAQAERMRVGFETIVRQLLADLGVDSHAATTAPGPLIDHSPTDLDAPNPYFDPTFSKEPPGGWFYGVGDSGRTGQDSLYEWLPASVAELAGASAHGHYLLAASDEVVSLGQHLHDVAVMIDGQEMFMLRPGGNSGGDGGQDYGPTYGTRADYLRAIGLPEGAPLDLQISFNTSGSGDGDAWLDRSHTSFDVAERGGPDHAYVAIVDDHLAGDWVQIGDIGPLGDDIGKMLGEMFDKYGAKTPEQQELIRSMLFRYDERFGILANRDFIEAACATNNARRQGFFEGPIGQAILTVVASFVGGPIAGALVSGAITAANGGSFGDVLRAGVGAYLGGFAGASFSGWAAGFFQGMFTPALEAALAGAVGNFGGAVVRELITDGRINGDALLASALAGAAGGFVTSFTAGSDLGQSLEDLFGDERGARVVGSLASALVAHGGHLSPADLIAALGVAATATPTDPWIHTEDGTDIMVLEGKDGTTILMRRGDEIIAMNPDGTFTRTTPDGTFPYDPHGNIGPTGPGPTALPPEPLQFTPAELETYRAAFTDMHISTDDAEIFLRLGLTPNDVQRALDEDLAANPLRVAGDATGVQGLPLDRVLSWLGRNDPEGRLREISEEQAQAVLRTALGQFMAHQMETGANRPAYFFGNATFAYGSPGWAWFNNMEAFVADNSTLLRALGFTNTDTCGPLTAGLATMLAQQYPDIEFREVLRGPLTTSGVDAFAHNFVQARILINPDAPVYARQYIYINIDPLKGEVYPTSGLGRNEAYVDPTSGALTTTMPKPNPGFRGWRAGG